MVIVGKRRQHVSNQGREREPTHWQFQIHLHDRTWKISYMGM